MSGHSKWANIRVRKGAQDKKRSAIFTRMAKDIIAAVKRGDGITNPNDNSFLRAAIDRSREVNMPKENVERLLKKFDERGDNMITTYLEGFGPENIAVVIEIETDNKIRTSNEVRHVLQEYGGSLADNNAVMFQFKKLGRVELSKISDTDWDKLIELGAIDIYDNFVEVEFVNLGAYVSSLEKSGYKVENFGAFLKAKMPVSVKDKGKIENFVDNMMELEDVVNVFVAVK